MADGTLPELRLAVPVLEDFAYLARRMRPDEIAQFLAFSGLKDYESDIAARALALTPGSVFALIGRDDRPVVAGGFEQIRAGVWECWLVGTLDGWTKYWRGITKSCRRQMDDLLADGAHRIQIASLASRTEALDWYETGLHMQREGVLRGYCADGQDAVMYSRVKEAA